jgi:hypothetical protein
MKDANDVFDHSVFEEMGCVNYDHDQEQAHYHFALGEIVYYISQYGIDAVMTDIYDYLEVEKQKYLKEKNKELCLEDQ